MGLVIGFAAAVLLPLLAPTMAARETVFADHFPDCAASLFPLDAKLNGREGTVGGLTSGIDIEIVS